jgi:hypothetical protein
MFTEFWNEILAYTSPYGKYLKYGEVLLRLKKKEENILKIREIISFDPIQANKTLIFLANLADKYDITIIGEPKSFVVGPSITKDQTFKSGMETEKIIKWYKYYGGELETDKDGKQIIIRRPKHGNQIN